jgi:phosphoenolpyruvate carboxykinase (ATP)
MPRNVFLLACDAYGVLPPISKLTPEMASYHFLSGFTAKVAGTEAGCIAPTPTFSACFGAPFMPRDPVVYADMLAERLRLSRTQVWLVNTGWSGGGCESGRRMPIEVTRSLLKAALDGALDHVSMSPDEIFKVEVPAACPGVPAELLDARSTWPDPADYDARATKLAEQFSENFAAFAPRVSSEVAAAGPLLGRG